ncbi:MAG: carbohydrate ABC transporter substrate-binding protein [Ruminococcus sp.]|nr:carbohydrate ABC transporter substrate-binding protein [Ruminococcus sp.]
MKKLVSIFLACSCLISLSACNNKKSDSVTLPDGKLDKCTLRFSWWGGDDRHEATLEAIELWNTLHPEITIEPEYGGWDGWTEKINTQINGSSAPDLMQINYDWLINLSSDGLAFYDLNLLTDSLDLSGFDEETLSFGKVNDSLNAVTVSMSGRGLFYNSQAFDSVGAEYPRTWNELIALGDTFKDENSYPLDLDIQSGSTAWYLAVVYVQQNTGREFITMDGKLGFTCEDIKSALDFYKSLEDNNVIRTVKERIESDGNSALYQSSEFIGGNIAGVLEWGSAVGKYESVLDDGVLESGPFLTDDSGNSTGWMIKPSLLYAISSNTKYPDEVATFMDFLLNNQQCAEILGTSRGIPASEYAFEHLEQTGMLNGLAHENAVMLNELDTVTISPYMELAQLKEYYNSAIEKVSYGICSTDDASKEMYELIESYLEKINR